MNPQTQIIVNFHLTLKCPFKRIIYSSSFGSVVQNTLECSDKRHVPALETKTLKWNVYSSKYAFKWIKKTLQKSLKYSFDGIECCFDPLLSVKCVLKL